MNPVPSPPTPLATGSGYDPLGLLRTDDMPAPRDYRLRLASPVTGAEEVEVLARVITSGVLTNGPWTRRFEEAMAARHGTAHAVAFANGTVALAAMFIAAGIGPGDEVIVPSLTFIATATSVLHVGATPVFADVDADTYCLDPADVARRITDRTRAIVPVHYGGQPAPMAELLALASEHELDVFEDAAQAHGASYQGRPAGSWGRAAMFSFTPIKAITTGEGGVVTTDDGDLAHHMRLLRNHGMSRPYHHEIVGYNWRLSELQAAMGVCQLDRLDQILATKAANARALEGLLGEVADLQLPTVAPGRTHPFTIYTLKMSPQARARAAAALDDAGIESRLYFPPAHREPAFSEGPTPELPVTDSLDGRLLSIPFHARVTAADLTEMATIIRHAVEA